VGCQTNKNATHLPARAGADAGYHRLGILLWFCCHWLVLQLLLPLAQLAMSETTSTETTSRTTAAATTSSGKQDDHNLYKAMTERSAVAPAAVPDNWPQQISVDLDRLYNNARGCMNSRESFLLSPIYELADKLKTLETDMEDVATASFGPEASSNQRKKVEEMLSRIAEAKAKARKRIWCIRARTSEAKDCSQNANLHRPLMDMGMLEKS
jgi:hypothetical protein